MRGKLILVLGLATGYVLGSRAGRPRYEQIKSGAEKVWNLAPVQQAAGAVKGFADERVDVLQAKAGRGAKKVVSSLLNLDDSKAKPKSTPKARSGAKSTQSTTMTPASPAPATAATDTDE